MHTFEHLSRGLIPDDLSTQAWGAPYARPFYAAPTEQEAYVSARLACLEMLRSGTTCFVGVNILVSHGHLDAVAQTVGESGMRAVLGRGVFDLLPKTPAPAMLPDLQERVLSPSAGAALQEVASLLDRWTSTAGGRIRAWASIYGLLSHCSDELFAGLRALADRYGVGMAFHMASSIEEAKAVEKRVGTWPITQLDKLGVLSPNLLLTHCTAVTDREVELLSGARRSRSAPEPRCAWRRESPKSARSPRCFRLASPSH
ncbi:amidohydrolase family protein [Bradyrhizobium sp. SRL28]|nr:amidohydrolase family protein [Bradyrhizobium sp. SRL28]